MSIAIALEKGLRIEYAKAYDAMLASPEYDLIKAVAMIVKSTSDQEKYGWLGDIPAVREWLGDKHAGDLAEYDYTIKNKNWETSIGVDKNDVDDDKYDMIMGRVREMPLALLFHRWEMIEDLLVNGTTGLSYDGSAFFADRTAPNDNLLAGTGGDTVAHVQADILTAYAAMYNFTSDTGRHLRLKMDAIACPVEIYGLVMEAVTEVQGATSKNVAATLIKTVIPIPGLSDTTDWYGLCTNRQLKPLILQTREEPKPVLDEAQVKRNRKYIFSADGRSNAGYGFHQMAVKVVNS